MIENIVLRTAITLGDVSNEGSCWFTRCGPSVARSAVDTPPVAVHALPEVGQDKFTVYSSLTVACELPKTVLMQQQKWLGTGLYLV
jgi:hypothetical protein